MSSEQEDCHLCKEYLRDPVSIPCGHIFCAVCLKTYWDHADHTGSYMCPQCRQRLGATQAEIQEKIHDRLKQMEELKQAVDTLKSSAHTALQECEKMFADMIRSIERMQQEMMKLISSNKRAALSNAEGHVERLSHEISDLKRRDNEITQLSRTEDHIHFIQSFHMLIAQTEAEELPTVSVNPYFTFGPVTKAVSEMKQHLNEFSNEELVKVAKAVNKMTFCQLEDSKKKQAKSMKSEEATAVQVYKSVPMQEPQHRDDFMRWVFLDHEGGTLAFYGVGETMSLIHRFKASFAEPVFPGFWVWYESGITLIQ
ncbi:hypothetical protein F7725_007120 [Dissostichus mawsoni]|uniref:RING-type domain-containing protein n=1 Tax=Dissostichus mawsoni TaxID=36200 RepID=A0A7J5XYT5_DISMA|nr:hypothetical protein F7725_007120 [Dissostichus mawsoni]